MGKPSHDLILVQGCEVVLKAHGSRWSLPWDSVALGTIGASECPQCGRALDDTEGSVTLGLCLGEAHGHS